MTFYILAPANYTSGGPELAHQLCYTVNKNTNYKAYMCYANLFDRNWIEGIPFDANAPESYSGYCTEHVVSLDEMDSNENIVVIPEGLALSASIFREAKIVLWWMSVDNYIQSTGETNLGLLERRITLHLLQSYYAKKYVKQHFPDGRMLFLSDYINEQHGRFLLPGEYRKNAALYNPKKGYENIEPLIKKITWIEWVDIQNLDIEGVIVLMQCSKMYIDFGNHPGKDRIPREAAANGCCVITNKKGSAAYHEDVPIPEQYKFEFPENNLEEIECLMKDICEHFDKHQKNFSDYRAWIKSEKEIFERDVHTFVKKMEEIEDGKTAYTHI